MLSYFLVILMIALAIVVFVAISKFRSIGTELSAVEFFRRLFRRGGYVNLTPAQLDKLLQNSPQPLVVIDLRKPAHYETGHIPNAISRPFDVFLREVVVDQLYDKNRDIVLVCDTGHMSKVASDILVEEEEFSHVFNLRSGMAAWNKYQSRTGYWSCCKAFAR